MLAINDGFMALDEYWVGITRYIPAQSSTLMNLVSSDDVKSPLQLMPMHFVAQAAYKIGIDSPYWQYRSVIFVLGLLNIILVLWAFHRYFKIYPMDKEKQRFLYLMLVFYFAAPFALTRPMFESVAAGWLCLAGVWALAYQNEPKLKYLLCGVTFGSVAFLLRQQLGFCALVFVILPAIKKNIKHLMYAGALGLLFFIAAGIPDYFIRGKFHYSLLNLTVYNFEHGSDYGDRTIVFYPVLLFIITLFPFFIKKYPKGFIREQFIKHLSLYIIIGLFIFLHSLFPQKWERFVISLIPLLILCAFPFLRYLHENFTENKIRLFSLYSLNFIFWLIASFFPAQKNLIDMSLYLNEHPEIKKVYRVGDTPGWITEAFILNKEFKFVDSNLESLQSVNWSDCSSSFIVGENYKDDYADLISKIQLKATFDVNIIESMAYKLNPKNNLRRVKLFLYSGCN